MLLCVNLLFVCMYMHHMCVAALRYRKMVLDALQLEFIDGSEPLCGCWGWRPGRCESYKQLSHFFSSCPFQQLKEMERKYTWGGGRGHRKECRCCTLLREKAPERGSHDLRSVGLHLYNGSCRDRTAGRQTPRAPIAYTPVNFCPFQTSFLQDHQYESKPSRLFLLFLCRV